MYVIDAGWYGNEPNRWGDNVGDWTDGIWMARRYTCAVRSSGQPGADQSVSMRPTSSALSRTSWRSGMIGSWKASM